ncbi:multiheme c-type cytochrome [Mucilaginibacter litoreus]|uniref:Multiheme c-type cytochrome n=2 Tax=Mucilaginibacter litoreus TaxID=1048221 RepID=A0ABW3APL0_9SPHI
MAVLSQCLSTSKANDPRGENYAGAKTCVNCHSDINNSYIHTAHYLASSAATDKTVHGSFLDGANKVYYNDHSDVFMRKVDSGMYQISYINGNKTDSARMDIVTGGIKGETYLYWKENELFELPVSFDNTKNRWIVSPGYDTTIASYDRMVNLRCMECHTSYAKTEPGKVPSFSGETVGFDKSSVILGVDCERCHGPGKQHADFHTENPSVKQARYIIGISKLTRAQRTDLCGTCHSGTQTVNSKSIFDFKPGDKLADFKNRAPEAGPVDLAHIDVHGDQYDMLKTSKCYISSNMDCSSCHKPHQNQRNNLSVFAKQCFSCHTAANHNNCKMADVLDAAVLKAKCVDCHMPALPSKAIINEQQSVLIRTHHIAVYPKETDKILAFLKRDK